MPQSPQDGRIITSHFSLSRRLASEALGAALLLAVIIGSGIMGERLSGGNVALALLANALATGAALTVLITVFGPISGAHFNPAVTFAFLLRRDMAWKTALAYVAVQIIGGIGGVYIAHAMFGEPLMQVSTKLRGGAAQAFSEFIATFGLLATIWGALRFERKFVPVAVGLYITAAY
jgi:glycerol uptake facilitator-like aquaporin